MTRLSLLFNRITAQGLHTDGPYDVEPFKATQLYALAIPCVGCDTHFASMYAADEGVPARLKHRNPSAH